MDYATYLKQLRNRTIATFYEESPAKHRVPKTTKEDLLNRRGGQTPMFIHKKEVFDAIPDYVSYADVILFGFTDILKNGATQNWGPTKCSRYNYLWMFAAATLYAWTTESAPLRGRKDDWDWDMHRNNLEYSRERLSWFVHALIDINGVFISGYSGAALLELERNRTGMTSAEQLAYRDTVRAKGDWAGWFALWNLWYTNRTSDGNVAASVAPSNSDLPNGASSITVTATTDDPNTFEEPTKWTPLIVGGVRKNYLTYNWLSVRSSCLTAADETSIQTTAATYFPTTSQRTAEIADVVSTTGALTDTQKAIAEFWAGGPGTASPPGILMWIWKEYMLHINLHESAPEQMIYSGLDLAQHLFEAGRLTWGIKKHYMQARPIQEVRRLYRGQTLTGYDGTSVSGEAWVPYQEANFVTPPFADYPSGHSTYSQVFASVMTDWFGSTITNGMHKYTDMYLVTPIFASDQSQAFGTFVIPARSSLVQVGVVPAANAQLAFETWQGMADNAGISRKYGGIHATSAHTGGQAIANDVHTAIRNRMELQPWRM
jgi:hypothetical protein